MRLCIILLLIASMVFSTSCEKVAEVLGSYPGLTLYFERASNGQPFADVTAKVVNYGSAGVSGADGKITLRVPTQSESEQVHISWWTLVPYQERTIDLRFHLGKGDNYYTVILQDDPRRSYKISAEAIALEDGTYIDGSVFIIPSGVSGTIAVPHGTDTIMIL